MIRNSLAGIVECHLGQIGIRTQADTSIRNVPIDKIFYNSIALAHRCT